MSGPRTWQAQFEKFQNRTDSVRRNSKKFTNNFPRSSLSDSPIKRATFLVIVFLKRWWAAGFGCGPQLVVVVVAIFWISNFNSWKVQKLQNWFEAESVCSATFWRWVFFGQKWALNQNLQVRRPFVALTNLSWNGKVWAFGCVLCVWLSRPVGVPLAPKWLKVTFFRKVSKVF